MNKTDYIVEVEKFNPYHDALGRFTTAGGGGKFFATPGKSKAHDNAIAREKARQAAKPQKTVDTFTANMTPMQRQKTLNQLNKKMSFGQFGVKTEQEMVEAAVSQGAKVVSKVYAKSQIRALADDSKPKQFDYLVRTGECRKNQYPDFVSGKLNTPIASYFRTKNAEALPDKYKTTDRYISTGATTGIEISKTALDYYVHLGGKPNTGANALKPF